jgi:hypothetical protein
VEKSVVPDLDTRSEVINADVAIDPTLGIELNSDRIRAGAVNLQVLDVDTASPFWES